MRKAVFLIAAAVSATLVSGASAQMKPETPIEYRQGVYRVIGWNFGPMAAMVKGDVPYDKEAFAKRAANVATMAPMVLEGFGPGTDKGAPTKAKPEIWTKMDDFKSKLAKMNEEATKLAAISKRAASMRLKNNLARPVQAARLVMMITRTSNFFIGWKLRRRSC
jgi:cytochrome c556